MKQDQEASDGAGGAGPSDASRLVYPSISTKKIVSLALAEHSRLHRDTELQGVIRWLNDTTTKRKILAIFDSPGRPKGAVIREFSHHSRYNLLHTIRNCGFRFFSMVTITYPKEFPREGLLTKKDLKRINQWFRNNFPGVRGVWFLEFQQRGAPHFHILLDVDMGSYGELIVRRRRSRVGDRASYRTNHEMERDLAVAWYRIVGSGDEKHLKAGVSWEVLEHEEAAQRYAAKHAAKPRQKMVPKEYQNVGRFWGVIGGVKAVRLTPEECIEEMTDEQFYEEFGPDGMSSKGKKKKYLWVSEPKEQKEDDIQADDDCDPQ